MSWTTPFLNNVRSAVIASGQRNVRFLHSARPRFDASKKTGGEVGQATQPPKVNPAAGNRIPGLPTTTPTALDKKFLIWSGVYKSEDQIPKQVAGEIINRVRSWSRIRINIVFLIIATLGGGVMVIQGKEAAKRGESSQQQNLDWHRKNREDFQKGRGQ